MPVAVVVLDANVLVPIVACDFLLTAFDLQLFEPIVSATVLQEVERTLIEEFPHLDPSGLLRRVEHMRGALADQTVDTEVIDGVPDTINTKDRHASTFDDWLALLATDEPTVVDAEAAHIIREIREHGER